MNFAVIDEEDIRGHEGSLPITYSLLCDLFFSYFLHQQWYWRFNRIYFVCCLQLACCLVYIAWHISEKAEQTFFFAKQQNASSLLPRKPMNESLFFYLYVCVLSESNRLQRDKRFNYLKGIASYKREEAL